MTLGVLARAFVLPTVLVACVGALAVLAVPKAHAQTLTEIADDIETLIEQGRNEDAMRAARGFLRSVTDLTGFGVTNARLISSPATGFGVYEPRDSNVYMPGEPVYAYVEVYGFSLSRQPTGSNRLLFDVSFTLDSLDGQQMTDAMIAMGDIQLESYSEPIDGFFHLTYRVTGALGAYSLRTSVTDRASGQTAQFTIPVEFAGYDEMDMEDDK